MFRYSILICLSLVLYGTTASPYKSRTPDPFTDVSNGATNAYQSINQATSRKELLIELRDRIVRRHRSGEGYKNICFTEKNAAFQDTRDDEPNEKMLLGLKEVEPLGNLDLTETDIDPSMFIWKAEKRFNQQRYNKPEEDKDQLYHSSEAQHTARKEQADTDPMPQYGQARLYEEPEKDLDDLYHNMQSLVYDANPEELTKGRFKPEKPALFQPEVVVPQGKYLSPEEDKDYLYHGKVAVQEFEPVIIEPLNKARRVYTEPEEDLDALYHK